MIFLLLFPIVSAGAENDQGNNQETQTQTQTVVNTTDNEKPSASGQIKGLGVKAISPEKLKGKIKRLIDYCKAGASEVIIGFCGLVMLFGAVLLTVGGIFNSTFIRQWGARAVWLPFIAVCLTVGVDLLVGIPVFGMEFITSD